MELTLRSKISNKVLDINKYQEVVDKLLSDLPEDWDSGYYGTVVVDDDNYRLIILT